MSTNEDEIRNEALRKGQLAGAFSGEPWAVAGGNLTAIEQVLKAFPPRPEREKVDPNLRFGTTEIAGRVVLRRDAGKKLMFLTIQDRTGQMQVALNAASIHPETMDLARQCVSVWDILGIEGELAFSNSGEPTLWAKDLKFMSKSLRSAPDKIEGVADKETRYRQRYLDLICDPVSMRRFTERSRIIHDMRGLLHSLGFIEVETPVLQTVANGATARPFETRLNALGMNMTLRIATEIALKKLLVAGMERVYEIGRIFRNEGIDKTHNPEFTSIELYKAYASLGEMEVITKALVELAFPSQEILAFERKDFIELLADRTVKDPWDEVRMRRLLTAHRTEQGELSAQDALLEVGLMTHAEVLDECFTEFVQDSLTAPTFVYRQPLELSPLCRANDKDPRLADRFELYMNGMEIANAYQELNDSVEQRRRLEAQGVVDEEFIEALEYGMPAAAGLGIGIDRLCMLATNAESIRDVILFPLMRPEARE